MQIILILLFQIVWIAVFMRPNSHICQLSFCIFYLLYHFNFSFDTQNLPLTCYHITSLLITAAVETEGNLTHKVNDH